MRISDWSSDVCSSDLAISVGRPRSSPEQAVPDDAALDFVGAAEDGRGAPVQVLRRTTDRQRVGGSRQWTGIAGRKARGNLAAENFHLEIGRAQQVFRAADLQRRGGSVERSTFLADRKSTRLNSSH